MQQNYKTISQNAIFLYIRMIVVMSVSFYTVRLILDILGIQDYGIYNLVASFVILISILNNTLAAGTQRFLTFEIGKKDYEKLKKTFSTSLMIHIILAMLILVLGETIGLWFLFEKADIPQNRLDAAFWTYQFSLFTMMVTITQIPYNAIIIAHEKMKVFAYISLIEAGLKLSIVYLLLIIEFDKLIIYSILMFLSSTLIAFIYRYYAYKNYPETHFKFIYDKNIFRPLLNFSAWNLFGALGFLLSSQGIAVLLNLFFGPIANAALAIGMQVNGALTQFLSGFQQAMTPTITKLYAINNIKELNTFLNQNVKYAYYLMWLLTLPIFININYFLNLWLVKVPEYTLIFSKLLIFYGLLHGMIKPLALGIQSTGRNKAIQLCVGTLLILNFPISYILLKNGFSIYTPFLVAISTWIFHLIFELYFLKKYLNYSIKKFILDALIPILIVTSISSIIVFNLNNIFIKDFINVLFISIFSIIINMLLIYTIGLDKEHRKKIKELVFIKLNLNKG